MTAPGRRPRFRPGERICPGLLAREQLSRGRRTECWLAWSVPLWSHVVVKLPCERHMDDLRDARRLGREARTLRRLAHPSIQRLLEDAHGDPVPHLVLEHVEGPTLARQLRDAGHLPAVDVVRIGMQLAACLHYLHGQGMVHLDIKPDNVALQDGRAVLLDFDVARRAGRAAPPSRSLGTHAYRAPEQCLGARCDPRMDLFALGAVLYELATGRAPFHAGVEVPRSGYPQVLAAPARARTLRRSLPADLDVVIHALLERDARRRPHTALETLGLIASALPCGESAAWPDFVDRLVDI